jgi:hypothetical protein
MNAASDGGRGALGCAESVRNISPADVTGMSVDGGSAGANGVDQSFRAGDFGDRPDGFFPFDNRKLRGILLLL